MGRKIKNPWVQVQIENSDKTFKWYTVKVPFPVNIEIRPKGPKCTKIAGTFVKTVNWFFSEKEKLVTQLEKLAYEVKSVKPLSMRFTELCPQCNRRGIPKIERKNTADYHIRSGRYDNTRRELKKRPEEWWLTFDHKTRPKKCRIQQYQGLLSNTLKPNKFKKVDIRKLILEDAIEELKTV